MVRRTKKQIEDDRKKLDELIENMNSVDDIMQWKNHPIETDNKMFTVEEYNRKKIDALKWKNVDVLYSFLGIYAIGLVAYYPDEFGRKGILITDSNNNNIYSLNRINEIRKNKIQSYQDKDIKKKDFLDCNEQLNNFIKVYFSIGNVIPTWPGANVDRGCSYMYDIPELYYTKNEVWTRILKEVYNNSFLDDILSPNLVFERGHEIDFVPPFWNFSSTEEFLDNLVGNKYSKESRIWFYSKWLERIVGIINKRTELLEGELGNSPNN